MKCPCGKSDCDFENENRNIEFPLKVWQIVTIIVFIIMLISLHSIPARADVLASYYTRASAQREGTSGVYTASGEKFKENAQTCAHPSLPFGTILKVTNPKNGRWYYCRVNDRGPNDSLAAAGRSLDKTKKGFELLKIPMDQGVAKVKIRIKK